MTSAAFQAARRAHRHIGYQCRRCRDGPPAAATDDAQGPAGPAAVAVESFEEDIADQPPTVLDLDVPRGLDYIPEAPPVPAFEPSREQPPPVCDYQAVFRTVKEAIDARGWVLAMEEVLADFELAVWHAAEEVLGVRIHACAFHWAAAVQKNAQKYGLEAAVHGNKEQW